jgi:hypothetical protein
MKLELIGCAAQNTHGQTLGQSAGSGMKRAGRAYRNQLNSQSRNLGTSVRPPRRRHH